MRPIFDRLALALTAVLFALAVWYAPVQGQPPTVLMLGDSAGSPQMMRAVTVGNFPLSSTLTGRNAQGVGLEAIPSQWSVPTASASGSVASASIAAEASVRHVAQCIGWSASSSGAVTAANGSVTIRDGATGAGTILAQWSIAHQVAAAAGIQTIPPVVLCGFALVGTTNTAMTAEMDAGVTGEVQRVWLAGINIQ